MRSILHMINQIYAITDALDSLQVAVAKWRSDTGDYKEVMSVIEEANQEVMSYLKDHQDTAQ